MAAAPFFEGLLPEQALLVAVGLELKISDANSFALLGALGRDCAGAVVVLPGGQAPDQAKAGVKWLSDAELDQLIKDLPNRPLGIDPDPNGTRLSLAGVQQKAIGWNASGAFGLPRADSPSTHLLKPRTDERAPELAVNEFFCNQVARCADLPVPVMELITIADRPCLLSQRYDRSTDGTKTFRLHQEDLCRSRRIATHQQIRRGRVGPRISAPRTHDQ